MLGAPSLDLEPEAVSLLFRFVVVSCTSLLIALTIISLSVFFPVLRARRKVVRFLLFLAAAVLVGLVFLVALVFLPGSAGLPHLTSAASRSATSWRQLLRHRPLLGCWLITLGGCFGLGAFVTFAPLYMKEHNVSVGDIGLVFALQAGINALSRLPCGRLSARVGRRWVLAALGFLSLGASLAWFGLVTTFPGFLLASSAIGLAMGLGFTPVGALIAEVVPATDRGLAMGGYNTCIYLGMMLSSAMMGAVIGWLGYAWSYALMGLIVALSTLGFFLLIRDFSGKSEDELPGA
jgi:predicted MFS family arabinose efflux permease